MIRLCLNKLFCARQMGSVLVLIEDHSHDPFSTLTQNILGSLNISQMRQQRATNTRDFLYVILK